MFASAVWSCVLPRVSEAVEAFVLMHAVAVGRSRARRKAILYTHTFLSLFGLSAGKTRPSFFYKGASIATLLRDSSVAPRQP